MSDKKEAQKYSRRKHTLKNICVQGYAPIDPDPTLVEPDKPSTILENSCNTF